MCALTGGLLHRHELLTDYARLMIQEMEQKFSEQDRVAQAEQLKEPYLVPEEQDLLQVSTTVRAACQQRLCSLCVVYSALCCLSFHMKRLASCVGHSW